MDERNFVMEEKQELENNGFIDISSQSTNYKNKNFKKKKHGIAGFFQRIGEGWKNMRRWKKATIITVVSLVLVASIVVGVILDTFNYDYNSEINKKPPQELGFENVIDQRVVNVALFGIDSRSKGFKGNSDSIMVLSIDTEAKTVKIVSIVRDSLVPIEYKGKTKYRKINTAYAWGGPELAIKTLNQNFGLDISEYATVNFNGMAEIIDAVGGIDAELVKGEVVPVSKSVYALNGCIKELCELVKIDPKPYYILEPGVHHLNGIQAVAYSRIRKTKNVWGTNNDYGRTDRQRYVMEQLFNKALTLPKTEYIKLAKAMMPHTQTSFSLTEIMGLAWDVMLKSPTFSQSRIPLTEYQMPGKNIKGVGDCVYYDLDYAKDILHAFFYDKITPEEYIAQNGVRKNDWYAQIMGITPSTPSTPETPSEPSDTNPDDNTGDTSTDTTPDNTTSDDTSSDNTTSDDTTSQPDNSQGNEDITTPPDDQEETEE
ncbi:MAG: LCP family protein [Clostridia bacterium]|nr:LCP family protein [Clostridia bacterium]